MYNHLLLNEYNSLDYTTNKDLVDETINFVQALIVADRCLHY